MTPERARELLFSKSHLPILFRITEAESDWFSSQLDRPGVPPDRTMQDILREIIAAASA